MLDQCAKGWTQEPTVHHYRVMWKGRTYPSLPKGEHGKKKKGQKAGRASVELGHIRHMVRQLEIDMDCAKKHLAVLQ